MILNTSHIPSSPALRLLLVSPLPRRLGPPQAPLISLVVANEIEYAASRQPEQYRPDRTEGWCRFISLSKREAGRWSYNLAHERRCEESVRRAFGRHPWPIIRTARRAVDHRDGNWSMLTAGEDAGRRSRTLGVLAGGRKGAMERTQKV